MLEPILTGHRIAVCNEHSATYYYWLVLALAHDDAVVHTNTAATLLDSLCQSVQCTQFVFPIFTTILNNFIYRQVIENSL